MPAKQETRACSPAGWAHIASEGLWQCLPYLDTINRELVEIMRSRHAGISKHLLLMAPPQHGKTTLVAHAFPCSWMGYFPDDKIILTSYEAETAEDRGKAARNEFEQFAPPVFGLNLDQNTTAASRWGIANHKGTMIARGVGGPITGAPCNLFIIDDPIKEAKDVRSQAFRDDQWEWMNKVALRRLRKGSCLVTIYTPWHEDDLGQRMIKASVAGTFPPLTVLRFPAISETQEERDDWAGSLGLPLGQPDPAGRQPGQALWPDVHTIESLLLWKKSDPPGFQALGQGRPRAAGGSIFKGEWFKRCKASDVPRDADRCRFWDKAGTQDAGDFTASVRGARSKDGRYFVENITNDRLSAYYRDEKIKSVSENDAYTVGSVAIRADQDPAQAGKSDAENFRRMLEKYDVQTKVVSGDKVVNARPFASAVESGNVWLVEAPWNDLYISQLESFNKGKFDDLVDASSGMYNHLAKGDNSIVVATSPFANYTGLRAS